MSGLRYRDTAPLRWRALDSLPEGPELLKLLRGNEQLLQLLPSIEAAPEQTYDDEPPSRHMQMLELRLRMLTELLADLLIQAKPLPQQCSFELSVNELSWLDTEPPAVGQSIMIEIYLTLSLPKPLQLPAVVASVAAEHDKQRVSADLRELSESLIAELDKLIFRQHRRLVASQRKG